jgi:ATP-dependent DNA helicase RecQ
LVANLEEHGESEFQDQWMKPERHEQIREACRRVGMERMKPIKKALPDEVSYDQIRLVMAEMKREKLLATGCA